MTTPSISATSEAITMSNGDLTLTFNRNFGGAPLNWKNKNNVSLVSPFAGEGCQVVYDMGQDGTQATCNGPTQNPVAKLFDSFSDPYAYYLSETSIGRAWNGLPIAHYQTSGIIPGFWASLEKIDDSVPPDPRGPMGWCTLYNNFLNLPTTVFTGVGVPLIFAPRGPVTSGMILLGDEIKQFYNPGTPWNQAYTKYKDGRVAWRCRINLKDAGTDAIAGIFFRKEVPQGTADINTLYAAHGYQLNFNKQGVVQLVKDNFTVLWNSPKNYKTELNSTNGLPVQIRTHYDDTNRVQILINGQLVAEIIALDYRFDGTGCFAQTSSGRIYFSDREVFDLNVVMTAAWFAYPDRITSVLGVTANSVPMYRTQLPVCFIDFPIRQMWEVKDVDGVVYKNDQNIPWQIAPNLLPTSKVKSFWIGQDAGAGIGALLERCPANGHMLITKDTFAINSLPFSANTAPVTIGEEEVVTHYRSTRW